jgi:hypothetical protein
MLKRLSLAAVAVFTAACGSAASTGSSTTPTPAATATPVPTPTPKPLLTACDAVQQSEVQAAMGSGFTVTVDQANSSFQNDTRICVYPFTGTAQGYVRFIVYSKQTPGSFHTFDKEVANETSTVAVSGIGQQAARSGTSHTLIVQVDATTIVVALVYVSTGTIADATRLSIDMAVSRAALARLPQYSL